VSSGTLNFTKPKPCNLLAQWRLCPAAKKLAAELVKSNGGLPPCFWSHITSGWLSSAWDHLRPYCACTHVLFLMSRLRL